MDGSGEGDLLGVPIKLNDFVDDNCDSFLSKMLFHNLTLMP